VAAFAVIALNLPAARAAEPAAMPSVAPGTVSTTNNLPATPELRTLDGGVLVDLRGPPPPGLVPGKQHCPRCWCANHVALGRALETLPNADPEHHCRLCRCVINRIPPDLPPGADMEMVAPRGGTVSGQALLRGRALTGVQANPPVLRGPGGATLPASAVQVRWVNRADRQMIANILSATPLEKQLQPVLVTVTVPADAAPGVYAGRLEVAADGFKGGVGIKLEVMPWVLPPPKDWKLHTGLIQSPDTIAIQYKVAPWSDEHLKYLEPSLLLLRDVGSESCYVFLIAESQHYARYSAVRRRGDGLDFAYFDKYLDVYQKVCGVPKTLTLHVWEGGYKAHLNASNSVKVTQIRADGTMTNMFAPYYGTAGSEAFWKPMFDGIRERLAKRGWNETTVLLGVPRDSYPQEEAVEFFSKVAPGWRWRVFTHGAGLAVRSDGKLILPNGSECGWYECCWIPGKGICYPNINQIAFHPKRAYTFTSESRTECVTGSQGWIWRDISAACVMQNSQGISQIGLGYWDATPSWEPQPGFWGGNLCQIGGGGGFNPRHFTSKSITVPGPNGAEPMLEYEWFREGVQAAAALALLRDTEAGKAFSKFLDPRLEFLTKMHPHPAEMTDQALISQARWNAALRELYKSAAETK
jgi:hypothetical protein